MRIIDLFNISWNGNKPPQKIKYDGKEYCFRGYDYKQVCGGFIDEQTSLMEKIDFYKLNDEVEIIEEQQDIEKAKILLFEETGEAITYPRSKEYNEQNFKELKRVTDELIKAVNNLKNKED